MTHMEISQQTLSALGLNEMQAKVYIAALELGESTMQALARKSGVNRSTVYTFIEGMKERGFILETRKRKRNIYSAAHPEAIVRMQKSKVSELDRILPELLAINNKSDNKPRVTFYEGDAIRDVYQDMLREKKEIVAYEDLSNLQKGIPTDIFHWFPQERAHRDILIRTISRDSAFSRDFAKKNRGLLRETKFVAGQEFKTDINIYGDKVALIDLQGETQFAVLIENHNLAETMRTVWRQLWDKLGPVVG